MPTWMAALIAIAAITATYYFCIRPMRRGECGTAAGQNQPDEARDREIAELREELRILRAEDALAANQESDAGKQPPAASA